MKALALVLLVLGVVSLIWGGIPYKSQKTVVELGDFKATATEQKTLPLPRPLGGVAVALGALLLYRSFRRP